MAKLNLARDVLAKIAQGNQRAVIALEQVFEAVGDTFPSTIEEANALAGSALVVAQSAQAALSLLVEAIARLDAAPAPVPQIDIDDATPRMHMGTIAAQNADTVEITGGTMDNVAIGLVTAAAAKFTAVAASDQITSTVATGTAPLIVASTTKVTNLYADRAASADSAGNLGAASTYPANATDLPTAIALVNALKAANTAKGV